MVATARCARQRTRELALPGSATWYVARIAPTAIPSKRTGNDAQERWQAKWQLTRRLYERGFDKRVIIGLYRFLDWVLTLPEDLAAEYDERLSEFEEEQTMEYITSTERRGIKIGVLRGSTGIILRQLQQRIGLLDEATQSHIRALPLEQIEELGDALFKFNTLADLTAWLQKYQLPAEAPV